MKNCGSAIKVVVIGLLFFCKYVRVSLLDGGGAVTGKERSKRNDRLNREKRRVRKELAIVVFLTYIA